MLLETLKPLSHNREVPRLCCNAHPNWLQRIAPLKFSFGDKNVCFLTLLSVQVDVTLLPTICGYVGPLLTAPGDTSPEKVANAIERIIQEGTLSIVVVPFLPGLYTFLAYIW